MLANLTTKRARPLNVVGVCTAARANVGALIMNKVTKVRTLVKNLILADNL